MVQIPNRFIDDLRRLAAFYEYDPQVPSHNTSCYFDEER